MQLNGITCAACHARSSDQHGNGTVEVIFDATYNAKSGAATYDPTTKKCSNISCHGSTRTQTAVPDYQTPQSTPGQTPDWITGTIDVNTQCTACHVFGTAAGNPENNSYWSGRHYVHVWDPNSGPQPKLDCTECHDTNKLAVNHLTALNTTIMEGPASATIVTNANYNGWDCSNASCHSDWGATW
jgi:predicted CxxxxCH...CXXCH cytochrome family protein